MIYNYKERIKPLDIIIVYNPKSWLHRMIYKVTKYKAGHVALYIGNGNIAEAQSKGVKINPLKNYTDKHIIYVCTAINLSDYSKIRILSYIAEKTGQRYSFLQLGVMLIKYTFRLKHVPDADKKAVICSEFIAECFEDSLYDLVPKKKPHEVTPADILKSDKVKVFRCQ